MIGPEKKSRIISEKERKLTAYHEAGHAVVLRTVSETDKVERISIIPAGAAGGYTAHKPHEDTYYATQSQLISQIMISLGGRAAEELVFGEISTGAANDLQSCNSIARDMIIKYGMSKRIGNLVFGTDDEVFLGKDYGHVKNYSEKLAGIIDEEIKQIIDDAYEKVVGILKEKMDLMDAVVEMLFEKEKIEGDEFEAIYRKYTEQAPADQSVSIEIPASSEVLTEEAPAQALPEIPENGQLTTEPAGDS
jgi:cell division protease FtsH